MKAEAARCGKAEAWPCRRPVPGACRPALPGFDVPAEPLRAGQAALPARPAALRMLGSRLSFGLSQLPSVCLLLGLSPQLFDEQPVEIRHCSRPRLQPSALPCLHSLIRIKVAQDAMQRPLVYPLKQLFFFLNI